MALREGGEGITSEAEGAFGAGIRLDGERGLVLDDRLLVLPVESSRSPRSRFSRASRRHADGTKAAATAPLSGEPRVTHQVTGRWSGATGAPRRHYTACAAVATVR
jgi:hypothetical protein